MKGDALSGIRQGELQAKAAERAKKKGKALAGGGRGGGRKRGGFTRSAGRSAVAKMKGGGRGITIEVWKNGKRFSTRLNYSLNKEKGAEIVYQNGDINLMLACAKLRPNIKEPCGHITMSLPPRVGKITEEEWAQLVETARKAYGLDDTFPLIAVSHADRPHSHVHLIFSRISILGKVHDQRNSGLKCAAIERILEAKHGLVLVPPSEFKNHDNHNSHVTQNEIEMAHRTHRKPPRAEIAAALAVAIQGRPTTAQFVERLQAAGIGVRTNVASTGKMNGFSFTFGGIEFGASKIAREYGWQQLEGKLDYEQTRDASFLTQLNGNPGSTSRTLADAVSCIDQLHKSAAGVHPTTTDAGTNQTNDPLAADRAGQLARQPKQTTARQVEPAKPTVIAGFSKSENLDISLRDWAGSLPNRIGRNRTDAAQRQRERALYDSRQRAAAISTADGYAIPEPRHLSDEQIVSLLQDLGGETKISGTPDFCERVEEVARTNGLKVSHQFQVTDAEREAAAERIAARQREEFAQKHAASNMPVFAPK